MPKRRAKRKAHVSKHILKSKEDDKTTASNVDDKSSRTPQKGKTKANNHTKHPEEAARYLTQWKATKSDDPSIRASSSWKFNKNTQSWLIRHMYEVDKVPKSTFFVLLEYLDGLEGKFIIDRIREDAFRRCRRHKEYCKSKTLTSMTASQEEIIGENTNGNGITGNDNNFGTGEMKKSITKQDAIPRNDTELVYEEILWRKIDDHEKRKQYKRARKILDLTKEKGVVKTC